MLYWQKSLLNVKTWPNLTNIAALFLDHFHIILMLSWINMFKGTNALITSVWLHLAFTENIHLMNLHISMCRQYICFLFETFFLKKPICLSDIKLTSSNWSLNFNQLLRWQYPIAFHVQRNPLTSLICVNVIVWKYF